MWVGNLNCYNIRWNAAVSRGRQSKEPACDVTGRCLQRTPWGFSWAGCTSQGLNSPPMASVKYLEEGLFARVHMWENHKGEYRSLAAKSSCKKRKSPIELTTLEEAVRDTARPSDLARIQRNTFSSLLLVSFWGSLLARNPLMTSSQINLLGTEQMGKGGELI